MKKFSVIMLALFLVIGFASCGGDSGTAADTTPPVITFNTPAENASFKSGETIPLDVTITDTSLKSWNYSVKLTTAAKKNTETWEILANDTQATISGASVTGKADLVSKPAANLGTYTITVKAVDTSNNEAVATRTFVLTAAK